jgi:hypothetical protein
MCKQVTDCFKLSNMALQRNNRRICQDRTCRLLDHLAGAAGQRQRESEAGRSAAVPEPAT